jgi:purine-binding chemotaxis protein CheW
MSDDELDHDDADESHVEHTYLTFCVKCEEYAVPVAHVSEIVRLQKCYVIPDVPSYVRGVLNLRGKVIPLVDVRSRFGIEEGPYTDRTVVVVLELGDACTGLIVDSVSEVAEIAPADVEPPPRVAGRGEAAMVLGLGKRENGVSFILDVNAMLEVTPGLATKLRTSAEVEGVH